MGSFHLLMHTHWDLEPFVPEDAPVLPLSAFPASPYGLRRGRPLSAFPPRFMESFDLRISDVNWAHEPKSNVAAEVTRR